MIILLAILFVFIIVGAVMAIEAKNLRASLISLGALGAGVSLIFLLLRAPGLALAQIFFMVICFIILRRAIISMDLTTFDEGREVFGLAVVVIMIITTFIFGLEAMRELPHFGKPLLAEVQGMVSQPKAIILDYRIYDTLLPVAVLFTAILGSLAILRKKK